MKKQCGFTLLEILIALILGVVLSAGVLSVFVDMRSTVEETSNYGELQENGRFVINLLTEDLFKQDYWGDYIGGLDRSAIDPVPNAPTNNCTGGGINNGTFPLAVGHFRTLWSDTVTSTNKTSIISDCSISGAKENSDVLQLKRAIAAPLTDAEVDAENTNYYIRANTIEGAIFQGTQAKPNIKNSETFQYQHHIYYIREDGDVPVLMQARLTNDMNFFPIAEGIEMMRFHFGVDTTGDGNVNAFIQADNMTDDLWDTNAVLSVKMFILARSVVEDQKYENKNTYQLGDTSVSFDDNYRRLLFTSTVTLFNARVDTW